MARRLLVALAVAVALGAAPGVASASTSQATLPGQAVVHQPTFGKSGTMLIA